MMAVSEKCLHFKFFVLFLFTKYELSLPKSRQLYLRWAFCFLTTQLKGGGGVWTCKRVIRSRKSKKDRYYNGQKKNRQTIICKTLHRKLKIESFYLHFSLEWGIVVELVEIQHPLMLLHEEMTVAVCNPYRSLDIFRLYIWGFVEHLADQTIRKGANKMKNK
jgi:hypothetical protein